LQTKIFNWPGVEIEESTVREYKDGPLFSHVLGYTGMVTEEELNKNAEVYSNFDQVGRAGIEKTYEDILKRTAGKIRIERDASGNQIKKEVVSLPESGRSLKLWLDAGLQKKIEEELKKTMENVNAKNAVAVALNPKTGGVLAMVSLPGFDNNLFSQKTDPEALKALLVDKTQPLLNRVIAGKYVTGSTIKPFEASGALQEKLISPDKLIDDKGYILVKNRYDPSITYKYSGIVPHGLVDMRKALAVSSNIYFYTIGGGYEGQKGLGPTNIEKYLSLFGWSEKTGIDMPNEVKGFVPTIDWKKSVKNEGWWDGDTYNLAIGQGDLAVTPLEVANAYAAVANGGTLYRPKVVKEVIDYDKNTVEKINPEVIRENFIDKENLQIVREGMRLAVTAVDTPQASCKLLNSLPVPVGCKTGTAQTPYADHYHNWISIFAPYDDPQIEITLMVENVDHGMAIVIPTMNEILKWYFEENKSLTK
ncbi:MAG: penicillin-binding transpeptidase domain-containing protein, partial [Candidatus Nealsonbacteria bacterium]|nr:penicillin-binding transpeptidase domain-containing protein [Candidatus Nealsonbacteria bacterium]